MKVSRTSFCLVGIQLATLIALVATGPVFPRAILPASFLIAGAALGLWALSITSLRELRIVPEPADNASLTERGPYRWIRHPMYAGVLLVALGWLIARFNYIRLALFIALTIDLLLKLHHEEQILKAALPGYAEYMHRTHRLIPGLF